MSFSEKEHTFTRQEVIRLFDRCLRKPLINLDGSGVFKRLSGNTKVTGIAGDVIEQSVLGYPAFLPVFSRSPLILLQSIQERRSHEPCRTDQTQPETARIAPASEVSS